MSSRQGGKLKPLKQAKKEKVNLDDDDKAFQQKKREEAKKIAELANQVKKKGGPLSQGGIKKSK